jgi:hypothetical protein
LKTNAKMMTAATELVIATFDMPSRVEPRLKWRGFSLRATALRAAD